MSCLFNSLGRLLGIEPQALRQQICDFLEANRPIMEGMETAAICALDGGSVAAYIGRMRLASTWGGAIEIGAACNLFNIRICVENRRSKANSLIEFVPVAGIITKTLFIYWTGGHYEPIRVEAAAVA
jgi:hypothetical protein